MFFTKKTLVILLVFTTIISIAANIYSFGKRNEVNSELSGKLNHYQSETKQKDKIIQGLNNQISSLEKSKSGEVSKEQDSEKKTDVSQINNADKLVNTAHRFIEYAFDNNPETYVARKKMARDYMTDELFETLYSADGVDENKQDIKIEVERVNVYLNAENDDEVIVYYILNEEIPSSGYKETIEKYVTLKFVSKENKLKVSRIDSINNNDGGI